jgi:hypothetical protein
MAQQSLPYNQQLGLPKSNVPWRAGHAAGTYSLVSASFYFQTRLLLFMTSVSTTLCDRVRWCQRSTRQ